MSAEKMLPRGRTPPAPPSGVILAGRWQMPLCAVLLAGAVALAYANSLQGAFVFDDETAIVKNPSLRHLWPPWAPFLAPRNTTVENRPVLNFTLALNYAVGGTEPRGYHVFNLVVHALAALTLFGLLRRTLLLPVFGGRFARMAPALAFAVALLWAVHPLNTAAVTYVVQRGESLMGLFFLFTLYAVLRSASAAHPGRWHAAAALSCALGMGCKEVMVAAPPLVLLYDRVFLAASFHQAWQRRWRLYLGLAGTWVLLGLLLSGAGSRSGSAGFGAGMSAWDYLQTQARNIVLYLALSVWPGRLVFDYGKELVRDPVLVFSCGGAILALLAATLWALIRRPAAGFLGAWFFVILAPTSSFVPIRTQTTAEHRMYLPLIAVITAAVLAAHEIGRRLFARRDPILTPGRRGAVAAAFVLAALALALGVRTWMRNADYAAPLVLWQEVAEARPANDRAHGALGNLLLERNDFPGAMAEFDQAVALAPTDATHYTNRGRAYHLAKNNERAIEDFTAALAHDPKCAEAYLDRANSYALLRRYDDAFRDYDAALSLRPDFAEVYLNRGITYMGLGEWDKALADFTQALSLKPDYAKAWLNRGLIALKLKQLDAALTDFTQALALKPDTADAYLGRAMVCFANKRYDEAWADVRRCRAEGGNPPAAFLKALSGASGKNE